MIVKEIRNWVYGQVDAIEPQSIPVGSYSEGLNFLTLGDRMELRRGYKVLGTGQGAGSVGGLGVGVKLDAAGTEVLFRKRKGTQKFEYYDEDTDDWAETGSDSADADSNSDDFAFDAYQSPAGAQVFWSSPNSSIYKILTANPASITDLLSTTYRGYLRIRQSRTFLWRRIDANGRRDEQNPYLSHIDEQSYTTVNAESIGTGDGAEVTFSDTLAFKAAGSKRTCFGIKVYDEDSNEIFTDNRDGTLTSDAGGTGTINYTTGAVSVTFAGGAPAGTKDIRCDYQWEDVTSNGIADFTFTSPTRVAGEGDVFLQGDGGPLMGVERYDDVDYCLHLYKTYALKLTADDTNATNLVFRDREGIPNWRAVKGTSIGIFYVNALDQENPRIKLLTLQEGSTAVQGQVISQNIDLGGYRFDDCEVNELLDYITVSCRTSDSTVNNRWILYHKIWKSFDIVDYYGLVSTLYKGAVHVGESISQDVIEAFSGVDDDGAVVYGYVNLNDWDLEYPGYLKKVKKIQIEGAIGPDQRVNVLVSVDRGAFVKVGQIKGNGSYVDTGQRVSVGPQTLGRGEIGGGTDGIEAYHYFCEFSLRIDKFERIRVRFEQSPDEDDESHEGIGHFSFSTLRYYDVRLKSQKLPNRYRS